MGKLLSKNVSDWLFQTQPQPGAPPKPRGGGEPFVFFFPRPGTPGLFYLR